MAPEKKIADHKKSSPIVPSHSVSGRTLMLLITIMTFLSGVTLGAVVLVQKSAIAWSSEVGREVTIQIRPIEGEVMQSNVRTAITLANSAAGVSRAFALSLDESEELLTPWLGEGLDLSALPVPRLIIVELDRADAQDIAQLKASIETIAGASLNTHAAWRQQLNTMAGTFVISGMLVLFLIASATVLAIIFATRGTMSSNRAIVDVLHFIGASNSFIAGEFQGRFLRIGLRGSIAGAVASLLFFFGAGIAVSSILPDQSGAQIGALFGTFSLGFEGIIAVSLLVPAISALTAVTSRLTVQRFLRNTS